MFLWNKKKDYKSKVDGGITNNNLEDKKKESKPKIGGDIASYNLEDWWLNDLTEEERKTVKEIFLPFGSDNTIDEGKVYPQSISDKVRFLGNLAHWFQKPEYYTIAKKILNEAEKYIDEVDSILTLHFYYLNCLEVHYRNRNEDKDALDLAIEYCKKQISISKETKKAFKEQEPHEDLPLHTGYKQLAIIYEKQGNIEEALKITKEALKERWNKEDCIKRIARLKKKLLKDKK
ncbi:hypothetical protein [uncultured Clostridium sp.]|uniref:hypothetical protein n=1 Tax=uncultured Clostridium sp. TaxID=59620 RepID=UPI0025FF3E42|nr:hypothetical protein [uncultured Clostridium sp.]